MIVTHLYGRLADVDALARIARERGIALIEDCAQAHGARRGGAMAGTRGALGCFSFYPTKNLGALGDAGAVVTGDRALAAKLARAAHLRLGREVPLHDGRRDELADGRAAGGGAARASCRIWTRWNRRRREIAARYAARSRHPAIALPPPPRATRPTSRICTSCARGQRESLRAHLAAAGVATDIHYPVPDHRQPGAGARAAQRDSRAPSGPARRC